MNTDIVLDQLVKDLFNEDELGAVIRAHLCVENLMFSIVESLSPNPEYLKKLNLGYKQTVRLALLLGLQSEFSEPLIAFGNLRNKFAHKPNMHISKNEAKILYDSLTPDMKKETDKSFNNIKNENISFSSIKNFEDLEPLDQFRLIVVSIWALVQSIVIQLKNENA